MPKIITTILIYFTIALTSVVAADLDKINKEFYKVETDNYSIDTLENIDAVHKLFINSGWKMQMKDGTTLTNRKEDAIEALFHCPRENSESRPPGCCSAINRPYSASKGEPSTPHLLPI